MSSPSTQGSPKVLEADCICQGTGLVTRLTATGNTGAELCDCVIPVSALLSDATVEALTERKLPAGTTAHAMLVNRIREEVRADLQAAIQQVGAGQGVTAPHPKKDIDMEPETRVEYVPRSELKPGDRIMVALEFGTEAESDRRDRECEVLQNDEAAYRLRRPNWPDYVEEPPIEGRSEETDRRIVLAENEAAGGKDQ